MITHPTKKELKAQKRYPSVDDTYAETDLGLVGVPLKSEQWIAGKSHKTHFNQSKNASQSLPKKTNTPGLSDGSAQAQAILGPTFEGDVTIEGAGVRQHALDYLKGKDVPHMGLWTGRLIGEDVVGWDHPRVVEEDGSF
jgi:hypothetical protein